MEVARPYHRPSANYLRRRLKPSTMMQAYAEMRVAVANHGSPRNIGRILDRLMEIAENPHERAGICVAACRAWLDVVVGPAHSRLAQITLTEGREGDRSVTVATDDLARITEMLRYAQANGQQGVLPDHLIECPPDLIDRGNGATADRGACA